MTRLQHPAVSNSEIRTVRRELTGAADERVLAVVRFVDALPERGRADELLMPLRDRLKDLHPPRPLRLARVLFTPLDPLIVSPAQWRPGTPALPRSIIAPISAAVRRDLGDMTAAIDDILQDTARPERARVVAAGAILWRAAATYLRGAAMPPEWVMTALPAAQFPPLALAVAASLDGAVSLDRLSDPSMRAAELEDGLAALLQAAERDGAVAWGMVLTLMLRRFPMTAAGRAAMTSTSSAERRAAAAQAVEASLAWVEQGTEDPFAGEAATAAIALRERIGLLDALSRDPVQRKRAVALQARLRQACAARLEAVLNEKVIAALPGLDAVGATDGAALDDMERNLLDIRRLDVEARRLDGGAAHDVLLRRAGAAIRAAASLAPMERARLTELLLGPQAALQLLASAGKPSRG
jgi:hypothetical protein